MCCLYRVKLLSRCNFSVHSFTFSNSEPEKVILLREQIDYLRSIHNSQDNTDMKIAGVLPIFILALCAMECSVSGMFKFLLSIGISSARLIKLPRVHTMLNIVQVFLWPANWMVTVMDTWTRGRCSRAGRGNCVVLFGRIIESFSASLHAEIQIRNSKLSGNLTEY